MNTTDNEKLSALVDNEVDRFQEKRLLDQLIEDKELKKKWSNYHLISDVMQNNLNMHHDIDLTDKIHAAIEKEDQIESTGSFVSSALKPVASFALAATVAVVAIMAFKGLENVNQADVQIAQSSPQEPIIIDRLNIAQNTEMKNQIQDQRMMDKLNNYLSNHAKYSSGNLSGTLPYARTVNFEQR